MLKRFESEMSIIDRYFREADGDEDQVSVTVAPRSNRGTDYTDDGNNVTVAPRTNRGTDYTQDDTPDDTGNENQEQPQENENVPEEDNPANDAGEDTGNDYTADDDPDAAGDDGEDGDAVDDEDTGTDYSANADGEGGNNQTTDTNQDQEESPEEREEKIKKYHMYKRFIRLYNVIGGFIEKLHGIVKNDPSQNAVIKTVSNSFTELYNNMFDYMTIKYRSTTYIQIWIYYQTVISIVQLNFELLRNNKVFI